MSEIINIGFFQFLSIYVLLMIVLLVMKKNKVNQSKLMIIASIRMSVQLVIAGYLLQWIFNSNNPIYTVLFLTIMILFSIHRILKQQPKLNKIFKAYIALSISSAGLFVLIFFVTVIVRTSIFNPQYTIPLAGMIIGNAMTGINIGLNHFMNQLNSEKRKMNTLLNLGVHPKKILKPMVNQSLEAALIPTINSMLGMGIVFLPGMMTGQILSGTLPTTAILYQIAIMIAIATSVCLTVFFALNLGYHTLYNKHLIFEYE